MYPALWVTVIGADVDLPRPKGRWIGAEIGASDGLAEND